MSKRCTHDGPLSGLDRRVARSPSYAVASERRFRLILRMWSTSRSPALHDVYVHGRRIADHRWSRSPGARPPNLERASGGARRCIAAAAPTDCPRLPPRRQSRPPIRRPSFQRCSPSGSMSRPSSPIHTRRRDEGRCQRNEYRRPTAATSTPAATVKVDHVPTLAARRFATAAASPSGCRASRGRAAAAAGSPRGTATRAARRSSRRR